MSWMDSWSRPGKSQAVPAPYYLLPGGDATAYCRSCGRVISSRKTNTNSTSTAAAASSSSSGPVANDNTNNNTTAAKYCSARCRHNKPGKLDREIEEVFVKLLRGQSREAVAAATKMAKSRAGQEGESLPGGDHDGMDAQQKGIDSTKGMAAMDLVTTDKPTSQKTAAQHKRQKSKSAKGDGRILVSCDEVEEIVFGKKADPDKVFGRKKNRASRVIQGRDEGDGGDDGETFATNGMGRFSSRGTTKFSTYSSDSAVELDEDDFDNDDNDAYHSDDHNNNNNGYGQIQQRHRSYTDRRKSDSRDKDAATDGHTVAALSVRSGTRVRPAQTVSEVNGSVGGEKGWAERAGESEEMAQRRIEGQQRAQRKEMVRCAARRGVVFGFAIASGDGDGIIDDGGHHHHHHDRIRGAGEDGKANHGNKKRKSKNGKKAKNDTPDVPEHDQWGSEPAAETAARTTRKCEAVMQGKVVEPSYAKGSWGVRWRED